MDFIHIFIPSKYRIFVLGVILNLTISPLSYAISDSEFQILDREYQTIAASIYTSLSNNFSSCRTRVNSLKQLNLELKKIANTKNNIVGICLIQNNLPIIQENIDSKDVFPIVKFLLDNNNLLLAKKVLTYAKNEGDKSLVSNISFIFSQYYLKRKNWNKVLQHTQGTYSDLTSDNADLARLYNGVSLQHKKKHREAINIYSKIPKSSKYYPAAKLNIATAYIRQDWWTDAHININEILKNKKIITNKEMNNRLYLVLGYSLLQKEFYRDSREAFRNIEIGSEYFNKALLGIALTATNQEDYIGALNAVNILKSKKTYDLSVDESHLLLPYIYEKLNQNMTASASYTKAQSFYEERIKRITAIKKSALLTTNIQNKLKNKTQIKIEDSIIDLSEHLPADFLINLVQLDILSNYMAHINNARLKNKFTSLKAKYKNSLSKSFNSILEQRITHLKSYLNQSRFGLARLFDHSNNASN